MAIRNHYKEYKNKLRIYNKLLEENPYIGVEKKKKNINKKCRIIILESYNIYYRATCKLQ